LNQFDCCGQKKIVCTPQVPYKENKKPKHKNLEI